MKTGVGAKGVFQSSSLAVSIGSGKSIGQDRVECLKKSQVEKLEQSRESLHLE